MADDLSLLFKLRGDNAQLKTTIAESRAAVASLKQSLGSELTQTFSGTNKVLSDIGENLTTFVGERIPLVGEAFARITESIQGLSVELKKGGPETESLAKQIESLAKQSGKTGTDVSKFLGTFTRLEGQAARNDAAFKFFGGSVDLIGNKTAKFVPELEKAGTSLAAAAEEASAAGGALAAMGGPIGIAVAAAVALAAGFALATNEIISLTKEVADFQGRMFDLAQQTGVEVETLSALEIAAKTTGGEIGNITQALVGFQRQLDDAQDPTSKAAESFRKLGVSATDTESALRQTFAALAKIPTGFAQTNAAAELFGARGGKQVLAILKDTNGDLNGTIKRLRELGILISDDDALAADKLNDEFALLDFHMRSLKAAAAEELIPAFVDIVKETEGLVRALRPLISVFGSLAGVMAGVVSTQLNAVRILVAALTKDYVELARAIRDSQEASETKIEPIVVPAITPVSLPGKPSDKQAATDAVNDAEAVVASVKRATAITGQALAELFEQGRRNRAQVADETIADNKKILEAEQQRIDALLAQKEKEIKTLDETQRNRGEVISRDSDAYRAVNAAVAKLQQERLDKENEFEVTSKAIRAKAAQERADSRRNEISNESNIASKEFDRQIAAQETRIKTEAKFEEQGLKNIEALERAKLQERVDSLNRQKAVGFLTIEEQKALNNQLRDLEQDRKRLEDEQAARRLVRDQATAHRSIAIAQANIDAQIQREQIGAQRIIDTTSALAAARVVSEEQAARKIQTIKLQLIDDEIEATQSKLKAAASIIDVDERTRSEADLNNQIKILGEQRKTIIADTNRAIDDARQEDLENERQYAKELEEIGARIRDIELDTAQEVIRLMRLHFASRKDIIRAQRDLDLQEEDERHRRVTDSIKAQQQEVGDQIRIIEQHLKSLKIGTIEEIEQYERLIAELEKLRIKRGELKAQQDAEDAKSSKRKRRVTDTATADLEREEPISTRSLFGDSFKEAFEAFKQAAIEAGEPINDLNASLKALAQSSADAFAQMSVDTGNFASFAKEAFGTLAQGLGQIVESYVLLGETGPAVLRKLLAQVLAHLAAEAAVKAIFELAEGFAMLFVNPAAAGAHFTASAIYGSVAGAAAIAGRAVAGDLFKSKTDGAGGGSSGGSGSGEVNPLTLTRNTGQGGTPQIPPQIQPLRDRLDIHVTVDNNRFGKAIDAHIIDGVNNNGPIRNVLAGDGNISGR